MGAGTIRSLIFSNWIMALFFIPYPIIQGCMPELEELKSGICLGSLFFLSQAICFLALSKGDASLVTPIMGTKSVFVAFFFFFFQLTGLPSTFTWVAALLSAIAVALLSWPQRNQRVSYLAIALGLLTAAGFGLTDALVPYLAQNSSPLQVIFIMFSTVGALSFVLIPFAEKSILKFNFFADKWMLFSCVPMGVQAVLMSIAIGFFAVPTEANIFYACRGIWAILIAAWLGKKIGLNEGRVDKNVFHRRLLGAFLLVIGICFIPF